MLRNLYHPFVFWILLLVFGMSSTSVDADAQPTNREVMISLVSNCLAPATAPGSTVSYTFNGSHTFIEAGTVATWLSDGKSVSKHTGDSSSDHLDIQVTNLDVSYKKSSSKTVARTVSAVVMATLTSPEGQIKQAVDCPAAFEDVLDRSILHSVEDKDLPVTTADHPSRGFLRKYVQPVVVGAASAVTVYLFFSIRSSNDSSSP